jgi:hypothetical protein
VPGVEVECWEGVVSLASVWDSLPNLAGFVEEQWACQLNPFVAEEFGMSHNALFINGLSHWSISKLGAYGL